MSPVRSSCVRWDTSVPVCCKSKNERGQPGRPGDMRYSVAGRSGNRAVVELALRRRVLLGEFVVHGEVGEDFEHPAVLGQRSLLLL